MAEYKSNKASFLSIIFNPVHEYFDSLGHRLGRQTEQTVQSGCGSDLSSN